jgi:hypothetical protein
LASNASLLTLYCDWGYNHTNDHYAIANSSNINCSAPENWQQVQLQLLQAQALQVNKGDALVSCLGPELQHQRHSHTALTV